MNRHGTRTVGVATLVALALVAAAAFMAAGGFSAAQRSPGRARAERIEQALTTDRRLTAAAAASRAGELGQTAPIVAAPPPGWTGEQLASPTADDWEPAVAADSASLGLHDDHAIHGAERVREPLPDAVHRAPPVQRRRRDLAARPVSL